MIIGDVVLSDEQVKQATKLGLTQSNLYARIDTLGWDVERAITEPKKSKIRNYSRYTKQDLEEAMKNGISRKTFTERIRTHGYTVEEAKTLPLHFNRPKFPKKAGE